ncbi:MAG: hypothetical protein KAH86_09205 [Methanosarcinales archaeon]|nr:hypothetical protein [Methanosarcinales archaeon]
MAEDRNMLIDRLGHKQSTQGNTSNLWDDGLDEPPKDTTSSLAGIENINARITKLEHSIVELTNTINGVMNELMDQKSVLNMMKNNTRSGDQGNVDIGSMQNSGHLLRPRHQHNVNVRSADNINDSNNDNPQGSSRVHIRHNPDAGASRGSSDATSDYIVADIDRSTRETDNKPFKGEYIVAADPPISGTKKKDGSVRYNEDEDVVVYEKGDK